MPVYLVKSPTGDRLVKASAKSVAINHVMRNTVQAEAITSTDQLLELQDKGMKVEQAVAEEKVADPKDLPAAANPAGD